MSGNGDYFVVGAVGSGFFVVTVLASLFSSRVVSMMKGQSGRTPCHWLKRMMMLWTLKSRSW